MKKVLLVSFLAIFLSQLKAQTYTTVAGGNGSGNAADQLNSPGGIFLDGSGNLYISDNTNQRIQKFPYGSDSATNATTIAGGNGQGSAANQLNSPGGLYIDDNGNLYVCDASNHRVQKFPSGSSSASNGVTVAGGNGPGNAANQLYDPSGISMDHSGNLYVADFNNNRVQKFSPGSTSSTSGVTIAGGNGSGSAANQLNGPGDVRIDTNGNIFILDANNNRVQKFPAGSDSTTNGTTVAGGNGLGSGTNQLDGASGIYVDASDNIYIADFYNNRVQKFATGSSSATNGTTVAGGNGNGNAANQLSRAGGVFVDALNNIYVTDFNNDRVQKWTYSTTGISTISNQETISLYPNPNSGSFILQSSGCIGSHYTVYDMIGRAVAQGTITVDKQNIELKDIAAGSYTLEVQGSKALRFVIEN